MLNQSSAEEVEEIVFQNMGAFYNRNLSEFKGFEENLGINPWFLEHFRMHFKLRNHRLKTKGRDLVGKHKNINENSGLLREMLYIIQSGRVLFQSNLRNILLVNSRFVTDDGVFRFNSKEAQCWTIVMNREIFSVMKDGFHKQWSNHLNTDAILFQYIKSFRWILDGPMFFWKFRLLLKKLSKKSKIDDWIFSELKGAVFSFCLYWFRFKSMELFFRRVECENILMWDENSPQQKVIQYAAKGRGIVVGAIQHGSIYKHHPAYAYTYYDVAPVLPDFTFVWGSHFRDILMKFNGYPPESIVITGKVKERSATADSNRVGGYWLFASQPLRNGSLRERVLYDVCKAATMGFEIIIRPHPIEKFDDYFNEISARAGLNNIRIEREIPLLQHLSECKGLIVTSSTVGFEFLEFNKPMIVMDYLEQDLMQWIQNDLGIKVTKLDELISAMSSDQYGLSDNRKAVIESLFFRNDDKALSRIMQHFKLHCRSVAV